MYHNLQILTQSSLPILPITMAKAHIRQDPSVNTLEDPIITAYLAAAASMAESYLRRTLSTKQYMLTLDYLPGSSFNRMNGYRQNYGQYGNFWESGKLPKPPLISVDSITYHSTTTGQITIPPSSYTYTTGTPGRFGPVFGQVFSGLGLSVGQIGAVQITYTAGYGLPDPTTGLIANLPPNITAGLLLLFGHLYRNREASTEGSMSELPLGVKQLFDSAATGFYA